MRLHGDKVIYSSGYTSRALDEWAERIRAWHRRGDVYVYFDNDVKVRAPYDALNLMGKLGLTWGACAEPLPFQTRSGGTRIPRSKVAYGPRVTGGNPAWAKLGRR